MYEIVGTKQQYLGRIFDVVTDEVVMPDGKVAPRDVVNKSGAVAVVAIDDEDRVVVVRQYRHPVRQYLWEIPAGLIDVDGEELIDCARRELAEETDLVAGSIEHLMDLHLSPGFTNEKISIYLARDLTEVEVKHVREAEEADMQVARLPLREAVGLIYKGEISNAATAAGIFAAFVRSNVSGETDNT